MASYNGPSYAGIGSIAGAKLRGLAVSMVLLGANLIGVGAGTFLIGAISDYVGGDQGIAWGIGVAMLFTLWGGVHLLLAARAIRPFAPERLCRKTTRRYRISDISYSHEKIESHAVPSPYTGRTE